MDDFNDVLTGGMGFQPTDLVSGSLLFIVCLMSGFSMLFIFHRSSDDLNKFLQESKQQFDKETLGKTFAILSANILQLLNTILSRGA